MEVDPFGILNRTAAAISAATLVDYIFSSKNKTNIINSKKVPRTGEKVRKKTIFANF